MIYYIFEYVEYVVGNMFLIVIFKFLFILIFCGGDIKRFNFRIYKNVFLEIVIMINMCIFYV